MALFFFFILITSFVLSSSINQPYSIRKANIIGGTASTESLSWLVNLKITKLNEIVACAGSIISVTSNLTYVVTAAHCVKNAIYIQAAGGRLDLTQTTSQEFGAAYQVFYTFIHSEYAQNTSANDIALLGLKQSNNYGTSPIQPVKISTNISSTNMSNISAISLTALGWGLNSSVSQFTSPSLMQANLTIISQEACAKEYSLEVITEKIFCAGHNNFATCKGDSGGPIIDYIAGEAVLVGITTFGGTTCGHLSSAFTKMSSYNEWISSLITKTLKYDAMVSSGIIKNPANGFDFIIISLVFMFMI